MAAAEIRIREDLVRQQRVQFGDQRPVLHANLGGLKLVAVGNELHYSDNWETFPDFLFHYIKTVLTPEWGNSELTKDSPDRHPIVNWYVDTCAYMENQRKGKSGLTAAVPSGPMAAYLSLSYDLYTLRHHSVLQSALVRRIRHRDQFQGARHEVFATAVCIRAGFEIALEDEADPSKRHPEFIATHKQTLQKIAVEAKSRHRAGVLGFPGAAKPDSKMKPDIRRLLTGAFNKRPSLPFVIFVDLNMPSDSVNLADEKFRSELAGRVARPVNAVDRDVDPYNLILFSNIPYHYGKSGAPASRKVVFGVRSECPRNQLISPEPLDKILESAEKYDQIPNAFPR